MNAVYREANEFLIVAPRGLTELVRGNDQRVVAQVAPLLEERSVALDFRNVRRVDAAGIAALISLYGTARKAGHRFTLVHANGHVAEILTLVGLERILVSRDPDATPAPTAGVCMEYPAA